MGHQWEVQAQPLATPPGVPFHRYSQRGACSSLTPPWLLSPPIVPSPCRALSPGPQSGRETARGKWPSLHAVLVWGYPPPICRCHHRTAAGGQSTLGPGGQNPGSGCPGKKGSIGKSSDTAQPGSIWAKPWFQLRQTQVRTSFILTASPWHACLQPGAGENRAKKMDSNPFT